MNETRHYAEIRLHDVESKEEANDVMASFAATWGIWRRKGSSHFSFTLIGTEEYQYTTIVKHPPK